MKTLKVALASLALGTLAFSPLLIQARDEAPKTFVEMCDASPEGTISKDQVMAMMGKAFDRHATRGDGKLDKKQARQFEIFLREFTRPSGA